jgi:hypothetical protein
MAGGFSSKVSRLALKLFLISVIRRVFGGYFQQAKKLMAGGFSSKVSRLALKLFLISFIRRVFGGYFQHN